MPPGAGKPDRPDPGDGPGRPCGLSGGSRDQLQGERSRGHVRDPPRARRRFPGHRGQRLGWPGTGQVHHQERRPARPRRGPGDRKSTRLNSSHLVISYAVFCFKKKKKKKKINYIKKNKKKIKKKKK